MKKTQKGKKAMEKKFEWKAEVKFSGTAEEFNEIMNFLAEKPVKVEVAEWAKIGKHLAGCNRTPIDSVLDREFLEKLTPRAASLNLKYIQDIRGGIRDPHIHMGDAVYMLEKNDFRLYATEVAKELVTRRLSMSTDYIQVMNDINALGEIDMD